MQAQKKKHLGVKLMTAAMLALLTLLSATNIKILEEPLEGFFQHELSFEEFVDQVQADYVSDDFSYKSELVNINGLFARLTGRRALNEVVRLKNGMLAQALTKRDTTGLANAITALSDFVSAGENIPFLYVQSPYKQALEGQSFPVGVESYANENADALLSQLSSAGIETLDLRPLLAQTPEMLEQYFYRTDHHWNSDGAFVAFQEITKRLYEQFPEGSIDLAYTQLDQWERHSIDNWFLGSRGKRVGKFFAGVDPLIWYTPKFETEMSCAVTHYGWLFRGNFAEANIRAEYIEQKDYFGYNPYCVYIGGDYALVQHRNESAPSPLKIMLIKDSFSLPLQAYLSTVFQAVDVVDPRYFRDCTIAEYARQMQPDMVICAINPGSFGVTDYQSLGDVPAFRAEEGAYMPILQQDLTLRASKNNTHNYSSYPLEPDTLYRVSFDGVDVLEGRTEGVGLRLYDRSEKAVLQCTVLDLAYCEATDGFSWSFRTPDTEDELQLLFYAGVYGYTAGTGVAYRNVVLEKFCSDVS